MKWAEHYWANVPCMKARVEEIARRCYGRTLEVGANDGFLTQCIREQSLDVLAIEIDPAAIAKAKVQFGEDFPIQLGDARQLPFPDESFDTVVGGELLEHLDNPGLGLAELFRVSKGHVILSLPIGAYWLGETTHLWSIEGQTIEHDSARQTDHLKELLVLEWFRKRKPNAGGGLDDCGAEDAIRRWEQTRAVVR